MATTKPTFAKMGLKMNTDVKTVQIGEHEVEVKQYLPVNDKLLLIGRVISYSADENNFANPVKLEVFTALEIVFTYTNITFTDKQKEDLIKLYDLMECNGVFDIIIDALPKVEYKTLLNGIEECAEAIYAYRNSMVGLLDTINQNFEALDIDATEIQKKIGDPDNLALLKSILTQLG